MPLKMKKKGSASGKPMPSPQLLGLVDAFLAQSGMESTHKAFTKEITRLHQSASWPAPDGAMHEVGLETVFAAFQKNAVAPTQKSGDESSSVDTDSESEASSKAESSSASSSATSSEESSDSEEEVKTKAHSKGQKGKTTKRSVSPSSSSSSSSSSSDSDADDEDEESSATPAKPITAPKSSSDINKAPGGAAAKNLKRKAESSSSESESSSSESDSPEDKRPAKRVKVVKKPAASDSSSSEASTDSSVEESSAAETTSSSSSSSSSEEEEEEKEAEDKKSFAKPSNKKTKLIAAADTPSESSGTVVGDNADDTPDLSHSEGLMHKDRSQMLNNTTPTSGQKKQVGARPTPLAQLSAQAKGDQYLSNAYQSYDYAEKAYKDLSVTRGKGFTKEKNKKKRGSYRGGAIDISGGKAFKFDD